MPPTEAAAAASAEAEKLAAGVEHINAHGAEHFGGALKCRLAPGKGRVLVAARSFHPGEVILREAPLHKVQEEASCAAYRRLEKLCAEREDDFDFEPLWYWCALRSLTKAQLAGAFGGGWAATTPAVQERLLLLHHEKEPLESKPFASARILARELAPGVDAAVIEQLTQVWVLNCFDYTDEPQGYCTYFFSSFMSHSCFPNAFWHYDGDDHVLRAREAIGVGDEVCISYLSEDWLVRSAAERRQDLLDTKRFLCVCPRCAEGPDLCRGFVCSGCGAGEVFPPARRPPSSGLSEDGDEREAPPELSAAICRACGRRPSAEEAAELIRFEASAAKLVTLFEEAPDAQNARWLEENIPSVLGQHWLAALAWEHLASFYADADDAETDVDTERRIGNRLRALRRNCAYHGQAYPGGRTGAHASALETLADALAAVSAAAAERAASSSKSEGSDDAVATAVAAGREAATHYARAIAITSLLHGDGCEQASTLVTRRAEVLERLGTDGVDAAAVAEANGTCAAPLAPRPTEVACG
eukprot:TRINITY_DN623_c1_g4_i1.p1 TRINITY_DN623_c1_g4~~TRINITY_DN623_c1_g4_i1.p1  ORF type:complete len:599 (+),score=140.89 TRINITY_DN623_c1_g4_i1:208-1797(+)